MSRFTGQQRIGMLMIALVIINIVTTNIGPVPTRQPILHYLFEILVAAAGLVMLLRRKSISTISLYIGGAVLFVLAILEAYLAVWS